MPAWIFGQAVYGLSMILSNTWHLIVNTLSTQRQIIKRVLAILANSGMKGKATPLPCRTTMLNPPPRQRKNGVPHVLFTIRPVDDDVNDALPQRATARELSCSPGFYIPVRGPRDEGLSHAAFQPSSSEAMRFLPQSFTLSGRLLSWILSHWRM